VAFDWYHITTDGSQRDVCAGEMS